MNKLIIELNEIIEFIKRERSDDSTLFVSLQLAEAQLELLTQANSLDCKLSTISRENIYRNTEEFILIVREEMELPQ